MWYVVGLVVLVADVVVGLAVLCCVVGFDGSHSPFEPAPAANDWSVADASSLTHAAPVVPSPAASLLSSTQLSYAGGALSGTQPLPVFVGFEDVHASASERLFDDADGVGAWEESGKVEGGMRADSTLRKRRAKMNKHKRRKWRKKMRDLGGKNLKQKK